MRLRMFSAPQVIARVNRYSRYIVFLLWGLYLGYPLHQLQDIRCSFLGYAIPVYFILVFLLTVGIAAAVIVVKSRWNKWEMLWWLLPLTCLPGIVHSADPVWSVRQWLSWMIRGLIPGGVVFLTSTPRREEALLSYWIYPIVVAAALFGVAEIHYDHNPIWDRSYAWIPSTGQPANPFYRPGDAAASSSRPRGIQGNRIPYTATIVGFLPFAFWTLKYKKRWRAMNMAAAGAVMSLLLLAQVRAMWLGALASVIFMWLIGLLRTRRDAATIVVGIFIIVSIFLSWPLTRGMLWPRMTSFHLTDPSIRSRLGILETARALKDHWILGVGFGQFPTACRSYYDRGEPWIGTPDNEYFRWAIENGPVSFALLAAFFVGLVRAGWKRILRIEDVQRADFYRAVLVGWLTVAVVFVSFDGFYWGACNMTFWCLLGLFATCLKSPDSETAQAV